MRIQGTNQVGGPAHEASASLPHPSSNVTSARTFSKVLYTLQAQFQEVNVAHAEGISNLSAPYASMIRLQRQVFDAHFKIETITKVADGIQSSVKRVSQQGV